MIKIKSKGGGLYIEGEMEPNADGLYEVARSVHFVYPAGAAQDLLHDLGLTYVSHKPGDYDTELWRKEPMITLGLGVGTAGAFNITGESVTSGLRIDTNTDNKDPEENALIKTDRICYQCGSRIGMHSAVIENHLNNVKVVELHVCMNPACSFHFVNVERS